MIPALTLAALSLAGCGGDREPASSNDTIAIPRNETVTLPAPPQAAEPSPTAVPSPTASASPSSMPVPDGGTGIPATLQGRWGLVAADCTSKRGDAKGLLTITTGTLSFYESRGTLGRVAERDASRIVADFAMSGEGQSWTRRMVLDGQDGGSTLIRREQGADAMPGALRYRKCA
ncbi:hypothetical protein BXU08_18520 [Sphingomonas sp. LM7]|nr:hypothetical protein BXU08_18520 [Sphingomonas sp. LM7]